MALAALRRQLDLDVAAGDVPCMVIGTAGSVSIGAVDRLSEIAQLCKEYGVWFHVDGAYGGFAASLPEMSDLHALSLADSVAVGVKSAGFCGSLHAVRAQDVAMDRTSKWRWRSIIGNLAEVGNQARLRST